MKKLSFTRFTASKRTVVSLALIVFVGTTAGCDPEPLDPSMFPSRDDHAIVGGSNTTITANPWQISLQTSSGSHFCGGSIVSSQWILTAAHCVVGSSASSMRVVAGITRRSDSNSQGQIRSVSSIMVYPGYTSSENGKDAALLELSSPLDLSGSSAQAIPIMSQAVADTGATDDGVMARVTGWGTLSSGSSSLPDTLQSVDVPIVSNSLAAQAYGSGSVTSDQLAAGVYGVGGKDSCQGDSGGPLTVDTADGRALAGIVSWGYGCADPSYPGMYGRVSSFESWIVSNSGAATIGGDTPTPDPDPDPDPTPTDENTLLAQTGLSGSTGNWNHNAITVPANTQTLTVTMTGGTGDADLYVRQGSQPTTSAYDCRPYLNGNEESCTIPAPAAGTWYVSIRAYASYSGVSVTATIVPGSDDPSPDPDPAPGLLLDEANLSGAKNAWVRYQVPVPADATTVTVQMSGGSGDADLYVRWGSAPTTTAYACRPYKNGNVESCDVAVGTGDLFIGLYGYAAFSGVTLKVASDGSEEPTSDSDLLLDQSDLSGAKNSWVSYEVDVPDGLSVLSVVMTGGSGDADLYVRVGAEPTTSTYDCRPYIGGNEESCEIPNPTGTVYVAVHGYTAYSGVSLTAIGE